MPDPAGVPPLTDGTVTLRAHRDDDVDGVYQLCVDPLTQEYTSVRVPYRLEDACHYVGNRGAAWEQGVWSFAIQSPWGIGAGGFSGSISLTDKGSGLAEINYCTHPQVRGHGVMTAAVKLICDWAFEDQDVKTILWQSYEGDAASRRVAWKTGFTFEGASRGTVPQRGELRDGWRATLLAADSREPKTRWVDPVILENDLVRLRPLRATETGLDRQCYDLIDGSVVDLVRFDLLRSEFPPKS